MARPTSMTRKLVTALTSVVAISWLLACGLGVMVMQDEFAEIFDAGVEETAERLLPLLVDDLRENNTAPAAQKAQPDVGTGGISDLSGPRPGRTGGAAFA